jgi:hypothetical protein
MAPYFFVVVFVLFCSKNIENNNGNFALTQDDNESSDFFPAQ